MSGQKQGGGWPMRGLEMIMWSQGQWQCWTDLEEELMNQSISDEGDCRTAPATPVLLKIHWAHRVLKVAKNKKISSYLLAEKNLFRIWKQLTGSFRIWYRWEKQSMSFKPEIQCCLWANREKTMDYYSLIMGRWNTPQYITFSIKQFDSKHEVILRPIKDFTKFVALFLKLTLRSNSTFKKI